MTTEYKVYSDYKLPNLVSSVNAAIQEGWQPLGGISVIVAKVDAEGLFNEGGKPVPVFYQSIVK